jgi:hypothetical protein
MADVDLYLMRVWKRRRGERGFRAALRLVAGDAAQVFSDPRRLADYIDALAAESAPADAAAAAALSDGAAAVSAPPAATLTNPHEAPPHAAAPCVRRTRRARHCA